MIPVNLIYAAIRPKTPLNEVVNLLQKPPVSPKLLKAIRLFNRITNNNWRVGDDPSSWHVSFGNTIITPYSVISKFFPDLQLEDLTNPS
jgi:hypothetical protein